ncbi:hypothetical protein HYH02_003285 [Chlamydomonas schloesseri]|uniref:Nucleotide-diphospho-sugar transferase domain-containing protein n=1 Tax=Chlamydomonas schloesseri TaxID=2026947 RepID=A0A835WRF9_9CHLO|nr:hypothetical protein HYH02_003285 [Chlamydomonas schloesseri]|eukprot:KAG2452261.1 hypothetical protein HYH02_003285 [Chlamydomonas schloesseri]
MTPHGSGYQHAHRVCDRRTGGKYCSSNKLKGYIGPIDTAAQIKEALAATAHEKELVVFSESRLGEASQTMARFRNAGYSHIIGVTLETDLCHRLNHVLMPWAKVHGPISCGMYRSRDDKGERFPVGFEYFTRPIGYVGWWLKWFTTARAVMLGYNVMAVDSDSLVVDDFYWRVKEPWSPDLAKYNIFTQSEAATVINSGFTYIQNAASNGPVAWMLYEMTQKLVRWGEDPTELFKLAPKAGREGWIWGDDQESMSDTLFSCMCGKPRFFILGYNIGNDPEAWKKLGFNSFGEYSGHINCADKWTTPAFKLEPGSHMARAVCEYIPDVDKCNAQPAANFSVQTAVLHMPHSSGEWPIDLGGYPFNKTPGPKLLAYRQAFKDLGVPLPPDPEDPATEAAARATKTELFALMQTSLGSPYRFNNPNPMAWVQTNWDKTGRNGLWHLHLMPDGSIHLGAGHVHAGLFPGTINPKTQVLMAGGHWDWRVHARVVGSPDKVYHTTSGDQQGAEAAELRRVLAYAPGVIPATLSKEQFVNALQGLAQLALALGATVAWPDVPCETDWVQKPEYRSVPLAQRRPQKLPWLNLDTTFQVLPYGDSLADLRCMWNGFSWSECLVNRRPNGLDIGHGLLPVEFHHLLARTRHELAGLMGSEADIKIGTTVKLAQSGPAADPLPPGGAGDKLHEVAYADLMAASAEALLRSHAAEHVPILWVDRLVGAVSGLPDDVAKVYGNWKSVCRALHYFNLQPDQRRDW